MVIGLKTIGAYVMSTLLTIMMTTTEVSSGGTTPILDASPIVTVDVTAIRATNSTGHSHKSTSRIRSWVKGGTFMGFNLQPTKMDTAVSDAIKLALETYTGPENRISSLKRHYNHKSDHYHGNAVDFEFSDRMIKYLVSDEGQRWLKAHNLYFLIEGKPGSTVVASYLKSKVTAQFVMFNEAASGNHIHMGIN